MLEESRRKRDKDRIREISIDREKNSPDKRLGRHCQIMHPDRITEQIDILMHIEL